MSDFRLATAEDLPAMQACAQEFYAASEFLVQFDIERFRLVWLHMFELGCGAIFLHEKDGKIQGAIGGIVHQDLYGHDMIAEEFFWFIRPEARGAGIRLYRQFEDWARSRGAVRIQMVHLLDLMPEKVATFYLRSGFRPIETRYSKNLVAA